MPSDISSAAKSSSASLSRPSEMKEGRERYGGEISVRVSEGRGFRNHIQSGPISAGISEMSYFEEKIEENRTYLRLIDGMAHLRISDRYGHRRTMGLHQAVALCMDHCLSADMTTEDGWFKTVVLAGGSACLPGLPERLEKELHRLLPPSVSQGIKVIPPPYGVDSAWFGGKLVSNLSTFSHAWCMTKKKFRQKSRRNSSFIGSW